MSLENWAKRHLGKVVDQDGTTTARVRLICVNDQVCLETWDSPFPEPQEWLQEVANLIDTFQNEWPCKTISLLFVADDKNGHQIAQCPKNVMGKNREANPDLHKQRDSAALAMALESAAKTMDRVLSSANAQMDRQNKTLEVLSEHHTAALSLIRAKNEAEAINAGEVKPGMDEHVKEILKENAPKLLDFFLQLAENAKAQAAARAAAASAAKTAANGVS